MVAQLESASAEYRRATALEPDQSRLKELIWQVLDLETESRFQEQSYDGPETTYPKLVIKLKESSLDSSAFLVSFVFSEAH